MSPTKKLVYRFLTLPYVEKMSIARALDLVEESDIMPDQTDLELYRLMLQRAQERAVLAPLWDAVERAHGDAPHAVNPFISMDM